MSFTGDSSTIPVSDKSETHEAPKKQEQDP